MPPLGDDVEVMGGLLLEELEVAEAEEEEVGQQFGPVTVSPPPSQRLLLVL